MWCGCVYLLATCSICQIRFLGSPPYWPVRCEPPSAGLAGVPASCGTAVCTGASQPKRPVWLEVPHGCEVAQGTGGQPAGEGNLAVWGLGIKPSYKKGQTWTLTQTPIMAWHRNGAATETEKAPGGQS